VPETATHQLLKHVLEAVAHSRLVLPVFLELGQHRRLGRPLPLHIRKVLGAVHRRRRLCG
jgi:hypothetical protein